MSLSFSDCFPDLLCAEDSAAFSYDSPSDFSSDLDSPAPSDDDDDEDSIAGFIEDETSFVPRFHYFSQIQSDPSARAFSISWMLKVRALYCFQPLTAYLAVNYLDRFMCSYRLPQTNGWPLQLLSVACLSLAAKMEERLVPSLLDFQVEGAKFMFEPKTIQRMELLILGVLDWRMRSVTPFCFITFFVNKLDKTGTFTRFLFSRSTDIILSSLQGKRVLEHRPSSIAAAAALCAASEIPKLSFVTPDHAESWCHGLNKEEVRNCYRLMKQYMMKGEEERGRRKATKAMPQLRVMSRTRVRSSCCSTSVYSSSSCSSSSSTTPSFNNKVINNNNTKRRKLNNWSSWVDVDLEDDKTSSD